MLLIFPTFKHLNIVLPESKQARQYSNDDLEGPRFYKTPNGNIYPSITSVLSVLSKEHIEKWKNRVGQKEANRVTKKAKDRGNVIHDTIEKYLKNDPNRIQIIKDLQINNRLIFLAMKKYLDRIDNIHIQEAPLYSDYFEIAGRCDCIAEYENKLSIVDFKGSNRIKDPEYIEAYWLQTAFYSYAYYELTGYKIKQSVILIGDETGGCQLFTGKPMDYWKRLKEFKKKWDTFMKTQK